MESKEKSVTGLTSGIEYLFKKNGVDYIKGTGTIISEHEIKVAPLEGGEPQTLRAKNIIIATGSEATPFPGLEIDEKRIVTSTGAIALTEVPKKMVVIGGGIIGLEMVRDNRSICKLLANVILSGFRLGSPRFGGYSCGVLGPDWWAWYGC